MTHSLLFLGGENTLEIRAPRFTLARAQSVQPAERFVPLLYKSGVYAFLTVFLLQAMQVFSSCDPGVTWPGLIWVFRTFTFLPLHEGGHVIFMFFGKTLHALGGSFWQIAFPLLWFIIALGQKSQVAPFPLFWVGENMMDVSLYIRDAPVRVLPLLGGRRSGHDWYYLLSQWDLLDSADMLADLMFYTGIFICVAAITAGIAWAVVVYIKSGQKTPTVRWTVAKVAPAPTVDVRLDRELARRERQKSEFIHVDDPSPEELKY